MEDIVLVTGEAVRYDYVDRMDFLSSLDPFLGVPAGHFTRPSLAGLHSCSYLGAIETEPPSPTMAEVLDQHGYTCIGLTTNPQAYAGFNFGAGFSVYENFVEPGTRGSKLREFLARFEVVQRVYQRLYPIHERRSDRPSDREVVEMAIDEWREASSPRFLWIHLMDSHRPYGLGADAVSPALNRKAKFSPGKVTDEEREEIRSKYETAVRQVDQNTEYLLDELDSDPVFAFAGDHGELLGEHAVYFHPPHEKRADDEIVQVPMLFEGIDVDADRGSLIDVGPTLVASQGIDPPPEWQGNDLRTTPSTSTLTIVPWQDSADVLWQDGDSKIRMNGCDVSFESLERSGRQSSPDISEDVKDRLRDFGYVD